MSLQREAGETRVPAASDARLARASPMDDAGSPGSCEQSAVGAGGNLVPRTPTRQTNAGRSLPPWPRHRGDNRQCPVLAAAPSREGCSTRIAAERRGEFIALIRPRWRATIRLRRSRLQETRHGLVHRSGSSQAIALIARIDQHGGAACRAPAVSALPCAWIVKDRHESFRARIVPVLRRKKPAFRRQPFDIGNAGRVERRAGQGCLRIECPVRPAHPDQSCNEIDKRSIRRRPSRSRLSALSWA